MTDRIRTAVVTGGAGFIGRWVVGRLLQAGVRVRVIDDLSTGCVTNLAEFSSHPLFDGLEMCSIQDRPALESVLPPWADAIFHLAARINVQDSIDWPEETFESDVVGTFNLLEWARQRQTRFVFLSSCMVYGPANGRPIDEHHPVLPASPYAASKLAGESLVISYGRAYRLPVCVLRPFNTYGPYQRSDAEGGVVAIFLKRALEGLPLLVFGSGAQTRDLLYVEDCADFIVSAGLSDRALGKVLNAGTGCEISIAELAQKVADGKVEVIGTPHPHPQAEIQRLICNPTLAGELLGFKPGVGLGEGLKRTREWLAGQVSQAEPREVLHAQSVN